MSPHYRKERLCGHLLSIQQLKDYYGDQCVGAAYALHVAGVQVHEESGPSSLATELSFDAFLSTQGIQFARSERHLHVELAFNATSSDRADCFARSTVCKIRGIITSPLRTERVAAIMRVGMLIPHPWELPLILGSLQLSLVSQSPSLTQSHTLAVLWSLKTVTQVFSGNFH